MAALLLKIVDAWYQRTMLAKLFSFASIGVLNAAVDLTAFTLAFRLAHLPLVASNVISWAIAVTCSYAMNTKITFSQETGGALSIKRYLRFAASGIFGMIVATTVLGRPDRLRQRPYCQTRIDCRGLWRELFDVPLSRFPEQQAELSGG